jgi:hypothetical protein
VAKNNTKKKQQKKPKRVRVKQWDAQLDEVVEHEDTVQRIRRKPRDDRLVNEKQERRRRREQWGRAIARAQRQRKQDGDL